MCIAFQGRNKARVRQVHFSTLLDVVAIAFRAVNPPRVPPGPAQSASSRPRPEQGRGGMKSELPNGEMITVKEAARRLGLCRSSVYEMVDRGQLPSRRIGPRRGKVMIAAESIEAYLAAATIFRRITSLPSRDKPATAKPGV